MREETKLKLDELRRRLAELRGYLEIDRHLKEIGLLEKRIQEADFWDNQKSANETIKELKKEKSIVEPWQKIEGELKEISELLSLVEEGDLDSSEEIDKDLERLERSIELLEFSSLFSEPHDINNAILSINAGAGGTESCDWVNMLLRMFIRWVENKGFKVQVLDILPGEEAGIKNVTILIKGEYAYGYLKSEHGIHRLVRISPFDANKRRHTSFASVEVIPEIGEDIEIKIEEKDLRIETFRASGPGGQHVNVTDSAVRITHLPTGIVVSCQNERSQHQNKATAMKILRSRLYELERKKREERLAKISGEKKEIAWGNQIRSYVLHPYLLVKDHRTEFETANAQAVLDGKLNGFIEAYLKWRAKLKSNIKNKMSNDNAKFKNPKF
ncbi:MAG: peptide chain release factor 2 [Candidatus Omnitrophica bacterium]|nr:peptide chain release factor 2 [Candidatus Omnitrophota bacterium]MCM8793747.1 peptide chain release factor 2 [Candidatus Omnitrophota bacterium]